jgi:hypothetical protein
VELLELVQYPFFLGGPLKVPDFLDGSKGGPLIIIEGWPIRRISHA